MSITDKLILDRQAMKDQSTSHLRIYIGGLTGKATVEELYEHFIPCGQINGIIINKTFGFIQFETASSAQDAISKYNGSVFQGKTLCVRTAQITIKRPPEVIVIKPDVPPAVALFDNMPNIPDDDPDGLYDSYGNYVGDKSNMDYGEELFNETVHDWGDERDGREERVREVRKPREDLEPHEAHEMVRMMRGRGGSRGRPPRGRGNISYKGILPTRGRDVCSHEGGDWGDRGGYDRYAQQMPEYARNLPVPERNDCEIIVVSKALTEYAEYIESRLKRLGIVVDLLFPMEDVPIAKVLGNIASRGCLYAILVMPLNEENRSLTLTILHGLPQEHRNMPIEDALQLISRNFQEVQQGGSSGREAVYALLGQLADGHSLTVLQYDKVIEYLQERKEHQVKIELGEPLSSSASQNKTQTELQQRIMSILNEKKAVFEKQPSPEPTPTPQSSAQSVQNKLLNDPTLRKTLDSILNKYV